MDQTKSAARARLDDWRAAGFRIGLVPTMGALHEGHLSLVKTARNHADKVIASIFVNPKQFAPGEDLDRYPRTLAADLAKLATAGADAAYVPTANEIYPDGFQTKVEVGALAAPLCGRSRPHFFGGVATIVCKLFTQLRPDIAVFGEKDFQQLLIIRRMARDLDLDVEVIGAPIVRHEEGLAMSSRNSYLSKEDRARALALPAAIRKAAEAIETGERVETALAAAREAISTAGINDIDYLEARRADDLRPLSDDDPAAARVFVAAMLEGARLIDNWPIKERSTT
ncbi:MAG: pantoate--beta-alanine ligase [Pseudomonadota bacterium]